MKKRTITHERKITKVDNLENVMVFRVLRPDETATVKAKGIDCKNRDATFTAEEHVRNGQRETSWISVTSSFVVALGWAIQSNCAIAVLDKSKIHAEYVDFRQGFSGKKGMANGWAISSQEICYKGHIDADAIVSVIEPCQLFLFQQENKDFKVLVESSTNPYKAGINYVFKKVEELSQDQETWTKSPIKLITEASKLWSVKEWVWPERVCVD